MAIKIGGPGPVGQLISQGVNGAKSFLTNVNAPFDQFLHNVDDYFTGEKDLASSYAKQLALQQQAQGYNAAEAVKARDWEKMMSDTAIQRQVADLKAAGLNPWLALQGGMSGAAVGSGQAATSSAGSVAKRSSNVGQLITAAKTLVDGGKSAGSMASSALRIAAIAIAALAA